MIRKLKSGAISWSDITREDWQLVESDKKCIYCGNESGLHREHIVPKSLRIKPAPSSVNRESFAYQASHWKIVPSGGPSQRSTTAAGSSPTTVTMLSWWALRAVVRVLVIRYVPAGM